MASKTIKVRARHVPHNAPYLTKGRIYEARMLSKTENEEVQGYEMKDDTGSNLVILIGAECAHIDGHWEVIE